MKSMKPAGREHGAQVSHLEDKANTREPGCEAARDTAWRRELELELQLGQLGDSNFVSPDSPFPCPLDSPI